MSVLSASNLTKTYKLGSNNIIKAVDGISLRIDRGDFLAIVGKSGSGKSTLMHMLGLLDTPTSGTIKLEGKLVSGFEEAKLAKIRNEKIGFVFQTFNLLSKATTLDNVILPLQYSTVPQQEWKQKAIKVLKTVELDHRLDNRSNELSGGQKQRVAIARALVTEPAVIFADEPTGNLDSKTGNDIVELFKRLNNDGRTVVIVTHDLDIAKIAQKIITIKDGRIISDED